ncbi:MAG: preprotein translocase subunit SecY, partial [Ruminococcus sp.]|nr:preprotein translocase subunit SecY [Ruminococcus sp.]
MFKTIRNAWSIPDLRRKILFTILIVIFFRIGSVIPVPFLDMTALSKLMTENGVNTTNSALAYLNTLSGGAFSNATLFAMGVTPYINSSIIMQLLTVAIPPLERMAKEGEAGRKKIATITRYVTVGLGLVQGFAYWWYLKASGVTTYTEGFGLWYSAIVIVLAFTAGTAVMMWFGEQINEKGIGNGISILLFAGIVARFPYTISILGSYWEYGLNGLSQYFILVPLWVIVFLVVVWVITFMQDSERRIPIQYAKRVVGRKMYGGQSTHLPIKVALGGVLPIIFASSILSIPSTIQAFGFNPSEGFWKSFDKDKLSEIKGRFIHLWRILLPLYNLFNKKLDEKGLSYEGKV